MDKIDSADPVNISVEQVAHTNVTIEGDGFEKIFYQNRVSLWFVRDDYSSANVSVLEPLEESTQEKLIVPMRAKPAVLEEIEGEIGDDRKFYIIVEVLDLTGKVAKEIIADDPDTYIEFVGQATAQAAPAPAKAKKSKKKK